PHPPDPPGRRRRPVTRKSDRRHFGVDESLLTRSAFWLPTPTHDVELEGLMGAVLIPMPLVGHAARPVGSSRDTEGGHLKMHRTSRVAVGVVGLVAAAGMLAGCGKAGSSGTAAPPSAAGAGGCAPVAGTQLVVLDDDKHL